MASSLKCKYCRLEICDYKIFSERTVKFMGINPICALTAVRSIGNANLLLRLIVTLAEYDWFMMNKRKL